MGGTGCFRLCDEGLAAPKKDPGQTLNRRDKPASEDVPDMEEEGTREAKAPGLNELARAGTREAVGWGRRVRVHTEEQASASSCKAGVFGLYFIAVNETRR